MSLLRYERYKESGVEWLGVVPEHWDVTQVRSIVLHVDVRNDNAACQDYLSLMANAGVIPYEEKGDIGNKKPDDLSKCKVVEVGDIVINSMNYSIGSYGMSPYRGVCSPVYVVLRVQEDLVLPRFAFRIFQNTAFQKYAASLGNGILAHRAAIGWNDLKGIGIALPPSEEQDAIATFLDRETAKIDALIEEQRRLIALLKEKRQAVITHAVTKGFNPSTPMKHSGIAWLGTIPTSWSIAPLKADIDFITSGSRGWAEYYSDDGDIFLRIGNLRRERIDLDFSDIQFVTVPSGSEGERTKVKQGDILFSITAYLGSVGVVPDDIPAAYVSQHIALVRLHQRLLLPEWVAYVTISRVGKTYLDMQAYGGTKIQLSLDDVKNIPMLAPPLNEQKQILRELSHQLSSFDQIEVEVSREIELLQERRSALISAAVTGKINVVAQVAKPVRSTWNTGFARQVIAAETLSRCNGPRMGRIKLQKLIHLCEYHAQLDEVRGAYSRQAAGPFAPQVMEDVREGLLQQRWFEEYKDESRYAYRALEKAGGHRQYLPHWEDKQARIDHVLNLLGGELTKKCEIVSTLYAAWNDLLIEGKNPTDAEIIHEASSAERWHESKEKIAAAKWTEALKWMRANGLVPVGYGTHTMHQPDLFTKEGHEPA